MTPAAAKLLNFLDLVLWTWGQSQANPATPGTVTSADKAGVDIFWADSTQEPTRYTFHEKESWKHIEQYRPNRNNKAVAKNGARKPKRKKAKR